MGRRAAERCEMRTGRAKWWKVQAAGMAVVAGLCLSASAREAEIRDVTAKQRYPWNGLVDIRCTVSGIEEGVAWALAAEAVEPDSGEVHELSHVWVVRDGTNTADRVLHADGEYELLWDARADLGEGVWSNAVVQVSFEPHPLVRLWEGGPYWADRNIGAEEPWEFGCYFWWGDPVGYKWEGEQWVASDGSASGFSFSDAPNWNMGISAMLRDGWITEDHVLAPAHDAAQVQWGRGWRMPTEGEMSELCDTNKCEHTWATTNGVKGYFVRGRGDYASACIFLPAGGWGDKTAWGDRKWGHYWASSPSEEQPTRSWRLNFQWNQFYTLIHYDRHMGSNCRPVRSAAEPPMP